MMTLTERDRECLGRFREAARQVRESSVVDQGLRVTLRRRLEPTFEESAELLNPEAVRSLAVTVRRAILQEDSSANLRRVHNILAKGGSERVRQAAAAVLARFQNGMEREDTAFHAIVFGEQVRLSLKQILVAWLYGGLFHAEAKYDADLQELRRQGPRFDYTVQASVLLVAGCMLEMDDIVAGFLGEPKLPRITAGLNSIESASVEQGGNNSTDDG